MRYDWSEFYYKKAEEILKMYPGISFENFKFEMTHYKAYYGETKYKLTEHEMRELWNDNRACYVKLTEDEMRKLWNK